MGMRVLQENQGHSRCKRRSANVLFFKLPKNKSLISSRRDAEPTNFYFNEERILPCVVLQMQSVLCCFGPCFHRWLTWGFTGLKPNEKRAVSRTFPGQSGFGLHLFKWWQKHLWSLQQGALGSPAARLIQETRAVSGVTVGSSSSCRWSESGGRNKTPVHPRITQGLEVPTGSKTFPISPTRTPRCAGGAAALLIPTVFCGQQRADFVQRSASSSSASPVCLVENTDCILTPGHTFYCWENTKDTPTDTRGTLFY